MSNDRDAYDDLIDAALTPGATPRLIDPRMRARAERERIAQASAGPNAARREAPGTAPAQQDPFAWVKGLSPVEKSALLDVLLDQDEAA